MGQGARKKATKKKNAKAKNEARSEEEQYIAAVMQGASVEPLPGGRNVRTMADGGFTCGVEELREEEEEKKGSLHLLESSAWSTGASFTFFSTVLDPPTKLPST